ncbi:NADPH-dependent oxidoreductase [Streptomyces triticagri]|uniref:NADPH-dependent oxidoreductase n=1 Tax=Streptomyces triticagri TaxID=2293568 RepID=A0A372M3G5_9ACTN|nr:NAD(P)H-dependent oxidoreductase [Streptomyces triticagri]RFU85474.1 NADPH-dependent oxidoreductase [Streptomyces triticagri]
MIRIAIVIGTTRPGRRSPTVAAWAHEAAGRHPAVKEGRAEFDVVDIADHALPLLDEELPAAWGHYAHEHTRRWAERIAGYDGFVFVTPEYNHAPPAALKNAIDFLAAEWHNKAAGFISYGSSLGVRAVEQLRTILGELRVADVASQVALSAFTDFTYADETDPSTWTFTPAAHQEAALEELFGDVVAWAGALAPLRAAPATVAA